MAYTDQKSATNQKAIVAGVVALLQGAAIVALVNGLAVHFIPTPKDPPLAGYQLPITQPPPPPPPPTSDPVRKNDRTVQDTTQTAPVPQTDLVPTNTGVTVIDPQVLPTGPAVPIDPPGTGTPEITIDPPVGPKTPPRLARARNAPGSWVGPSDYPVRDLDEGHEGLVKVRLAIGIDGRVTSCQVVGPSGFPGLDNATCNAVSRRARFDPARDESGARVAGSYTGSIRWVIPD